MFVFVKKANPNRKELPAPIHFLKLYDFCVFLQKKFMEYTVIVNKDPKGFYVGQCEQIPEAVSQGETLDELLKNMKSCIKEALLLRKEDVKTRYSGQKIFRRKVALT
jgi:predicted RNase H-like HicB family nuclease